MFRFCTFLSPKFPRKHQSTPNKNSFLPLFALIRYLFALLACRRTSDMPELMKAGLLYKAGYSLESIQKATTPPPIWGAASAFYPHNFSPQKSRKKSPWQDWKNFGKNLRENVSGKEKAPNLVERGQGVLKYERIVWAKIVELFVIARGEFFHFVFVP